MRRSFLYVMLLLLIFIPVFYVNAQNLSTNGELFVRTIFDSHSDSHWEALAFSRFGFGIGLDYGVVPHVIRPGARLQVGFSPLYLLKGKDECEDKDDGMNLFDIGGRLYNEFGFGSLKLQPFVDYTVYFFSSDKAVRAAPRFGLGLFLALNSLGLEYAYIFPGKDTSLSGSSKILYNNNYHRVGISYYFSF